MNDYMFGIGKSKKKALYIYMDGNIIRFILCIYINKNYFYVHRRSFLFKLALSLTGNYVPMFNFFLF